MTDDERADLQDKLMKVRRLMREAGYFIDQIDTNNTKRAALLVAANYFVKGYNALNAEETELLKQLEEK